MRQHLTRRGILAGLLAATAMPLLPQHLRAEAPLTSLFPVPRGGKPRVAQPSVASLIAEAKLTGIVTFVVADAATGQVIEAEGADTPVPPASVTKTVTSLYALETLGAAYRFATRVVATGPLRDGIVQGDLVLVGGGDPTLDTDRLAGLAERLAGAGIKGVTGGFHVFEGALPAIARVDRDQPDYVSYNPSLSGLNLNFNRVHFSWRRTNGDYSLAMDARSDAFVPPVRLATMRVVDRDLPLFAFEAGVQRDNWSVARGALGREGSRWLPVRQPGLYAGEVLQWLAAAQGVTLPDPVAIPTPPQGETVAQDQSDTLVRLLADMLRFSTNLTAEAVGLTTSAQPTLPQSAAAMTLWAKEALGMTSTFVDHSGLGAASQTTAADIVRMLVGGPRLRAGSLLPGILRDIGMRDAAGEVIEGDPVRVRAKSGTLNFVSGLAGFITPPAGRQLAFAIYAADVPRRAALRQDEMEDPEGGEAWTRRARVLQGRLISRWAGLYG
ncbi:MAG: D-alanyl-D-alanine carboxypeptidase/D-alanyl-D-alanine-endopeptidase [Rhodobacteraceae bacterium]|nr:D-alanyl-D-alanine carboxypeptidase/D-alanyl-D-alanine-endopeptidase [Paracoccaceae bacterium]